jgi:hypothetical protein
MGPPPIEAGPGGAVEVKELVRAAHRRPLEPFDKAQDEALAAYRHLLPWRRNSFLPALAQP